MRSLLPAARRANQTSLPVCSGITPPWQIDNWARGSGVRRDRLAAGHLGDPQAERLARIVAPAQLRGAAVSGRRQAWRAILLRATLALWAATGRTMSARPGSGAPPPRCW